MANWSEADLAAYEARRQQGRAQLRQQLEASVAAIHAKTPAPPRDARSKYGAHKADGPDGAGGTMRYDSQLGARLAKRLEEERQNGGCVAFVPEPSFIVGQLGGKPLRHRVDHMVVLEAFDDGSVRVRFLEAKGRDLAPGRRKREAFERRTGAKVQVFTKAELRGW